MRKTHTRPEKETVLNLPSEKRESSAGEGDNGAPEEPDRCSRCSDEGNGLRDGIHVVVRTDGNLRSLAESVYEVGRLAAEV